MKRLVAFLFILVAHAAHAEPFSIMTLADGSTHCFNAFLKQDEMDALGLSDPQKPPKQKWPVKYCFMIPRDKSFCRWSYEISGKSMSGTKSFSSWVLHRLKNIPAQDGWTTYHWAGESEDYNESTFQGVDQECLVSDSSSGGGWVSGRLIVWPKRLSLEVMVAFTLDGERADDFAKAVSPPSANATKHTKGFKP
jgi:hypothetical protein